MNMPFILLVKRQKVFFIHGFGTHEIYIFRFTGWEIAYSWQILIIIYLVIKYR